jgi:hypothetical protein
MIYKKIFMSDKVFLKLILLTKTNKFCHLKKTKQIIFLVILKTKTKPAPSFHSPREPSVLCELCLATRWPVGEINNFILSTQEALLNKISFGLLVKLIISF